MSPRREQFMSWYWQTTMPLWSASWLPTGAVMFVQNNIVGRIGCAFNGHQRGRSVYCDYCGKDMSK